MRTTWGREVAVSSIERLWFQRLLAGGTAGLLAFSGLFTIAPATPAHLQRDAPSSATEVGKWLCAVFPSLPGCHSK
ncbi:MAG: hypothetical protein LKI58_09135 [Actinomyces sp.]|jgi:hypothetical protein|nr:hypothetical protein [Actinomyces sp.]MCI1788215.1 hypothetical protein [Actinomyces sp.]